MYDTRALSGWSGLRLVAVGLAACLLAACAPEQGSSGGRIDSYRTTGADRGSDRASIPALLEFSDQAAGQLMQNIMDADEIRNSQTKLVLELGLIANQTQTPTSDFEQIQARLRGKLSDSKLLRSRFIIVDSRSRMNAEMARVNGDNGNPDLLQEGGGGGGGTARYDPKLTYVLSGDFYESDRGDRKQYYFEFKLVNVATREIVIPIMHFDLGQKTRHDD